MKKMKRLFAVLLTLAMVMGMSITAFADLGTATIPVNGAKEGTTYQYLQLIQPNTEKDTGWAFVTDAIASNFKKALDVEDDQTAIWMLIKHQDSSVEIPEGVTLTDEMMSSMDTKIKNAIEAVANGGYTLSEPSDSVVVDNAGMYYIRAIAQGYTYNPMAAYVSFGYTGGIPSKLESEGVNAKGTPIDTEKTSDQTTQVTEIGRTVTYYIGSIVPFVPLGDTERKYTLKDTITGADYEVNDGDTVTLTVYYGAEGTSVEELLKSVKGGTATAEDTQLYSKAVVEVTVDGKTGKQFEADLSSVLENNTHANQPIVIAYEATVTDTQVGNNASIGDGDNESQFGTNDDELYTVQITINKKDAKDGKPLDGAEFVISKDDEEDENAPQYYAVFENNKFVRWEKPTGDAKIAGTPITAENGTVTVTGLGEGTYHITETKAPDGYSINTEIEDVTVETVEGQVVTANLSGERDVLDTQLSALPSTGGIGTTIFTIAGCLIMVAAAGLFFVSRRKSAK